MICDKRIVPRRTSLAMKHSPNILIVGGPTLASVLKSDVRQLPFTFGGMSLAYQLSAECETLILIPDRGLLASMPEAADFSRFNEDGALHLIHGDLGVIGLPTDCPIPDHVTQILGSIPDSDREKFISRAAASCVSYLLGRTFNLVNSGGTVYLLAAEDLPAWSMAERNFVATAMPGVYFSSIQSWSACVGGAYAWMLDGTRSSLEFGIAARREADAYIDDTARMEFLVHPEDVLSFLPPEAAVQVGDGAMDRAGGHRVLVLKWGKGHFVIAPAVCWNALLAQLGISSELAGAHNDVAPCAGGSLLARLPQDPLKLEEWDRALGWGGADKRSGSVKSVKSLAATLDSIPPGKRLSSDRIPVPGVENQPTADAHITGEALRKLIERKGKTRDLSDEVKQFLAMVMDAWRERFLSV